MARKKTTPRKKTPARAAAARAKTAAKPRAGKAAKASPGSDVERRWNEYWSCRKKLEDAVATVKSAREALQEAQDAERSCRSEFEAIKGSLTDLLDVEPAGQAARPPTAIPQRANPAPQGLSAPAGGPAPKPAS